MAITETQSWISAPAAGRIMGKHPSYVRRLAKKGLLTTRRLLGGRPEFSREDVLQLLSESIRPAKRHSGTATSPQPSA